MKMKLGKIIYIISYIFCIPLNQFYHSSLICIINVFLLFWNFYFSFHWEKIGTTALEHFITCYILYELKLIITIFCGLFAWSISVFFIVLNMMLLLVLFWKKMVIFVFRFQWYLKLFGVEIFLFSGLCLVVYRALVIVLWIVWHFYYLYLAV